MVGEVCGVEEWSGRGGCCNKIWSGAFIFRVRVVAKTFRGAVVRFHPFSGGGLQPHQRKTVNSLHEVAKVLEFQL